MKVSAKLTACCGAILYLGPVFALVGMAIGMMGAFDVLARSEGDNLAELSHQIDIVLWSSALGLLAGCIGLALILVALFSMNYRAKWFFVYLCIFAAFWIIQFPIGTVIGGLLLWYLIRRRHEFMGQEKALGETRA